MIPLKLPVKDRLLTWATKFKSLFKLNKTEENLMKKATIYNVHKTAYFIKYPDES